MNRQKSVCQTAADRLRRARVALCLWSTTKIIVAMLICVRVAIADESQVSRTLSQQQKLLRQSSLPKAFSKLEWKPKLQRFSGTSLFEVRQGTDLILALYANRALHTESDNRNDREFNAVGFPGEDIWSMNRSGALFIRSVRWMDQEAGHCGMAAQDELLSRLATSEGAVVGTSASYELNRFETLLRVKGVERSAIESRELLQNQTCRLLALRYDFFPPRTEGNFGFQSAEKQIYSGPIAPLAVDDVFNNSLLISGIGASCLRCEMGPQSTTRQQFIGMPTPLHIGSEESVKVEAMYLANFKVGITGDLDSDVKEPLVNLLHELLEKWNSNPGLPRLEAGPGGYHFFVGANALKERLAFAQTGELQTGPGLLKVSAFLSKYHRAAFARELLILLLQQGLSQMLAPVSWEDIHIVSGLAQYQARELLMGWFDGLDSLKDVSSKFSFIPLFDDILAGKALQNNEVFLGEQETPTKVDSLASGNVFPTLTGKQISDRLRYCLADAQLAIVKDLFGNLLSGDLDLNDLSLRLDQIESANCTYKVSALLRDYPVKEVFIASRLETSSGRVTFKFTREGAASGDALYFNQQGLPNRISKMGLFYDTPRIRISERDEKKVLFERVWPRSPQKSQSGLRSGFQEDAVLASKETVQQEFEESSSFADAEIEGPTNGSSTDRHVIPRRYKFLISGLKLSYDSKEEFLSLQTGVQFKLLGDEYQRSLGIGLNLDNKKFELLGGFSLDLIGLVRGTDANPEENGNPKLVGALFNSFPFSLGVQNSSGFGVLDKNTTAAYFSIGAENRNTNKIVPNGYAFKYKLTRQLLEQSSFVPLLTQQVYATYDQAIGTLTTLSFAPVFGMNEAGAKLSDYVPGSSLTDGNAKSTQVKRFLALSSQIKAVVLTGFNLDLLGSLLFQDLVAYGAHHFGSDVSLFRKAEDFSIALQTVEVGFQLFGSFFGAKNQSLAFSFFRTLTRQPSNSFSVTIGRN